MINLFNKEEYQREYRIKNKEKAKEYKRQYYIKNRKKIKEKRKRYYIENKEKIKERVKQYRIENREKVNRKKRQYYIDNPEKKREQDKKYNIENQGKIKRNRRKYYIKNREILIEKTKQWTIENSERRREYAKRYFSNNKEKRRVYINKWTNKKLKTDLKYNLNMKISHAIYLSLRKNKAGRTWESLTDYTLIDLIRRLNETMPVGYTWKDFLTGELHIDHIIPIGAFNFTRPEHTDFKRCWALSNLRLLPVKENLIKGANLDRPFQPALKI
ncbi:hypothetical protein ES708_32789 [subsurface metagenome]